MSFKDVFTSIALCSTMTATSSSAEPDSPLWTVPISGYFSENVVNEVINRIENLRALDLHKKITVEFFDVQGGESKPGFDLAQALYDAGNLDVVCRGDLQSMGATVFASYKGDGERIAAEDCHLAPVQAFRIGIVDRFETAATSLPQRLNNLTPDDIYAICETSQLADQIHMEDEQFFHVRPIKKMDATNIFSITNTLFAQNRMLKLC